LFVARKQVKREEKNNNKNNKNENPYKINPMAFTSGSVFFCF